MAAGTLISVEEYLRTSYSPDCDYVDGEVRERNLGEFDHATLQTEVAVWFANHRREWKILVVVEQRVQIAARRFRIPDVAILPGDYSKDPIVRVPPLICVEVLSPEDRTSRVRERCNDYLALGVGHVWVIDPAKREGFAADAAGFHAPPENVFSVPGTPIHLPLQAILAALD
jgi:Uma2 family endonuclease